VAVEEVDDITVVAAAVADGVTTNKFINAHMP
jgi:hypothetical protein